MLIGCGHEPNPKSFRHLPATQRPYKIKGQWYYPQAQLTYAEEGLASYYGKRDGFHGKKTSTGEKFDTHKLTAAHKTLPLPCVVEVTNLDNGRSLKLKVNDRGPFVSGRIIDVSEKAAHMLGFYTQGIARVRVQTLPIETAAMLKHSSKGGKLILAQGSAVSPMPFQHPPLPPRRGKPSYMDQVFPAAFKKSTPTPTSRTMRIPVVGPRPMMKPKNLTPQPTIYIHVEGFEQAHYAEDIQQRFPKQPSKIQKVIAGKTPAYRVRFGPFLASPKVQELVIAIGKTTHKTPKVIYE